MKKTAAPITTGRPSSKPALNRDLPSTPIAHPRPSSAQKSKPNQETKTVKPPIGLNMPRPTTAKTQIE